MLIVIFAVFTNYFVLITQNNYTVAMTSDSQNLLRSMVEELRYGAGVRQSNSISDPNSPVGGWNTNNANFVIIIAMPVKDSNGDFIIDTNTGFPYQNEFVYYKNGNVLYKRILANTNASGNSLKTTCPVASSGCPGDIKLVENINTVSFVLYDQDNNTTINALLARSINIHVLMEKNIFGKTINTDDNMRITLRNVYD
jgi:hypothetical protein